MLTFSPDHYRALRQAAGVCERPETALIAAAGRDRLSYLHAMLTNDIAALVPGRGCYSAFLTPQGRMIADMTVLELGDLALVRLDANTKDEVLGKLEQFIFSEDVQLHDLTQTLADVQLIGPNAAQVLAAIFAEADDRFSGLEQYQAVRLPFEGGTTVVVSAGNLLAVPAFDVYIDRAGVKALTEAAVASGAARVGAEAVEAVRIEAGVPRFGADMDQHTIPLEAGIEGRAISFSKGCYPGQEVIIRVVHRGHGRIARKLVGMAIGGDTVPDTGDRLVVDGKDVGVVTSAVYSPALGHAIALGYVQRDLAAAGHLVSVLRGRDQVPATIVDLPFVGGGGSAPRVDGR